MIVIHSFLFFFSWIGFQDDGPRFNGVLQNFIDQNIIYPGYSKANCIQGTVLVNFNIGKKGKVSNVFISRGLGVDLDEEAIRVIKLTNGKWETKNAGGKSWNMVLPVKFALQNPSCIEKSSYEIKNAIAYYQIQEHLQNSVFEYYKKKNKGEHDPKNESQILQLKQQLGFNEQFVSEKLEEAKQMIKQKDIENACKTLQIIKNIGSTAADNLITQYCN